MAEEWDIKLPTSVGSSKKQESSRKTSISALLTMSKPLTVWITTNWKILKEMGVPDHLTCLLRNLYANQEATVRTWHGTTDWFQIKYIRQGYILSFCLFHLYADYIMWNTYADYIMWNTGLDEAEAGIKIAGRNSNNLRYTHDITLLAESKELKNLLMEVKEENENAGLKFSIKKVTVMASGPITSWQILEGKVETVTDFLF